MSSTRIGIGVALLLIVGAAAWALRGMGEREAGSTVATSRREALAHPGAASTPTALTSVAPAATRGPGPSAPAVPAEMRPGAKNLELVDKLFRAPGPSAPEADRLAWESSRISDLLYPGDHPCAGRPRDSVSQDVLTGAAQEELEAMLLPLANPIDPQFPPALELDRPQCHLQGNWPFFPLNECAKGLNREDPESVARFRECLALVGEDPKAYPADLWVPCPSNDPEATTQRDYYRRLVAARVGQLYAEPPCSAD